MKDAELREALQKLREERRQNDEIWCDEAGKWYFEALTEEAVYGK